MPSRAYERFACACALLVAAIRILYSLTFAVSGLAFLLVGWLVRRGGFFPRRLGDLSLVAGFLLLLVYLGRLVIFDRTMRCSSSSRPSPASS